MEKKYEGLPYLERLKIYSQEKLEFQNIGLTPQEYEQRIRELCDRLGI